MGRIALLAMLTSVVLVAPSALTAQPYARNGIAIPTKLIPKMNSNTRVWRSPKDGSVCFVTAGVRASASTMARLRAAGCFDGGAPTLS